LRDESEFRHMAANCIDQHGALADQELSHSMQHQRALLLFGFDRDKAH
jgi:hypothetical protein